MDLAMTPRSIVAALLIALLPASVALAKDPPPTGQCADNFTVSGSYSDGKTFKTSQEYTGLTYASVFDKIVANITEQGLSVIDQSKDRGYIRASNPVKGGSGGTAAAPLRVLVMGRPDHSIKVDVSYNIAGGQITTKKIVMTGLCKMLAAPLT